MPRRVASGKNLPVECHERHAETLGRDLGQFGYVGGDFAGAGEGSRFVPITRKSCVCCIRDADCSEPAGTEQTGCSGRGKGGGVEREATKAFKEGRRL